MKRNEFGHYLYSDKDIKLLKEYQSKIQNNDLLENRNVERRVRMGNIRLQRYIKPEGPIPEKMRELERKLETKADSVVTYQLLQHRKEIEDLRLEIEKLSAQIEYLKSNSIQMTEVAAATEPTEIVIPKRKKKTVFHSLFGF